MNNFRKLIAVVILLTGVFTITLSVNAFKPAVTDYGHTSITQKVIGDNGYPAGHGGNSLIGLAQFQAILSSGKTITFSTEAAKHLVEGVQSNDWISGSFGEPDTLGESGSVKNIEGVSYRSVFKAPQAHCDDDLISECRGFIKTRYDSAFSALNEALQSEKSGLLESSRIAQVRARLDFGRLLHTLKRITGSGLPFPKIM